MLTSAADPSVKEKSQVSLCASWGAWSLKCSIERLDRQNRKFAPILIITEAKSAHFFKCTRSGFVYQELRDFVKMSLTRVTIFGVSTRVTLRKIVTRLESRFSQDDSTRVTVNNSLTRVTLSPGFSAVTHNRIHRHFSGFF